MVIYRHAKLTNPITGLVNKIEYHMSMMQWTNQPTGRTDNSYHAPATLKWICEPNTVTELINPQCQLVSVSESKQNAVLVRISCDMFKLQGRTGQLCLKFTLPWSMLAGTINLRAYTEQHNIIMGKYVSVSRFIRTGYSSRPTLHYN